MRTIKVLHPFLFGTCEPNLPESFTEPCCLEKRPTRQALARCSANSQVWRLDAVNSALLLRSKALSREIKAVFLTDLHNHGRRFYWSQAVNKSMSYFWMQPEICSWFSFQSRALSESRFERKRSFLRAQLNPTVSAKLMKCSLSLELMPVEVESCPSLGSSPSMLLCEHKHGVRFAFWSFKGTERRGEFEFRFALGKSFTTHIRFIRPLRCFLCSYTVTFYHSDWDETVTRFPPWR